MSSFLPNFLFGTPKKGSEESASDSTPASPSAQPKTHPNRIEKAGGGKKVTAAGRKGKKGKDRSGKLAARLSESSVLAELENGEGPASRRASTVKTSDSRKDEPATPDGDDDAIQFASQPAPIVLGALADDGSSQEKVSQTQTQSQTQPPIEGNSDDDDLPPIEALLQSKPTVDPGNPEEPLEAEAAEAEAAEAENGEDASPEEDAGPEEGDDDDDDEQHYTFTRLLNHRWAGDQVEILVEWHGSQPTWEPETNLHADAPDTLFRYWQGQGGRPTNPRDPDLFDIFAIRDHNKNRSKLLVEWTGYPESENCWVSRKVLQDTAPDVVADYWETLSRKK